MSEKRVLRRYTAEEKAKATARAVEIGYRAVSRETGIPRETLSGWICDARQGSKSPAERTLGQTSGESPVETAACAPQASRVVARPAVETAAAAPLQAGGGGRQRRPRVAKVYTPSQIAQALERVKAIGVRPAAKELGIARTTLRAWEWKTARAAAGDGPAPTSGADPKAVAQGGFDRAVARLASLLSARAADSDDAAVWAAVAVLDELRPRRIRPTPGGLRRAGPADRGRRARVRARPRAM